jgi:DNA-binding protein H-NS
MTIDLSALTVEELNAVITQAQQLIKAKRKSSIKQARAKIEQMAADLGVTVAELLATSVDVKVASTKERKKVAPIYRNTANAEETWTGRGKKPRWLVAALAAGKQLEDFSI